MPFIKKINADKSITNLTTAIKAVQPSGQVMMVSHLFSIESDKNDIEVSKISDDRNCVVVNILDKESDISGVFELDLAQVVTSLAAEFSNQLKKKKPADDKPVCATCNNDSGCNNRRSAEEEAMSRPFGKPGKQLAEMLRMALKPNGLQHSVEGLRFKEFYSTACPYCFCDMEVRASLAHREGYFESGIASCRNPHCGHVFAIHYDRGSDTLKGVKGE